jgi:DTW domain-containing protein
MHVGKNLHALPKICFTPTELSRFRIKRQPFEYCVSTIEAVHHLLEVMDKRGFERLEGKHHTLIEAIDSLVSFQESYISTAGTSRHFKKAM